MKQYFIAENGKPIGAFSLEDLKYRLIHPVTLIWSEGWSAWQTVEAASATYPELAGIIGKAEQAPIENSHRVLSKVGMLIDQLLSRNEYRIETHFFYKRLHKRRSRYLAAPAKRQRAISFFLSSYAVLLLTSLCLGLSWGWFVAKCWMMFMAASEFPYLYGMAQKLSDDVLRSSLYFVPQRLWNWLTRFSGAAAAIGLATFVGNILAPAFALYQLFHYMTACHPTEMAQSESLAKSSAS